MDGSAQIARLRYELEIDGDNDSDLMAFVGVESETDTLPVGAAALNWSKEALVSKEPELRDAREWAFKTVRVECENLIARFSDA